MLPFVWGICLFVFCRGRGVGDENEIMKKISLITGEFFSKWSESYGMQN